eukprot:scaffold131922_cov30-Tisochrysis_lutea.AAC.2
MVSPCVHSCASTEAGAGQALAPPDGELHEEQCEGEVEHPSARVRRDSSAGLAWRLTEGVARAAERGGGG